MGHVNPDADSEGTNAESDPDVEKQFDESTGKNRKKRKFASFHEYRVVEEWATGPDSFLEDAVIDHQIQMHLKKFMQDSRLMIAQPCRRLFQNIDVQANCYHSRSGHGRAEAVCHCTTPQSHASTGQSGAT